MKNMTREENRKKNLKLLREKFSLKHLLAPERRHYLLFRIILLASAFLLITGKWYFVERNLNYRIGYPSPKTYYAISSAIYEDDDATHELREREASKVLNVITKDEKIADKVNQNISDFKNGNLTSILSIELAELYRALPVATRSIVAQEVIRIGRYAGQKAENSDEKVLIIWNELKKSRLSQSDKNIAFQILNAILTPYVQHDKEMTARLKKNIASQVPAVVRNIQPGMVLIQKGEIISRRDAVLLQSQGYPGAEFPKKQLLFVLLIIAVWSMWPIWIENGLRQKLSHTEWRYIATILSLSWLLEIISASMNGGYALAILPMTGWLCLTIPVALSYHLIIGGGVVSVLIAFNSNQTMVAVGFLLAIFAASIGRVLFLDYPGHRGSIWKRLFLLGVMLGIIDLFVHWGAGMPLNYRQSVNLMMFSAIWSTLVIAFLPIWEASFDVISPLRLLEFCDQTQPLLKRLQLEAPGTYHHTMMTGNLALAAADRLGMNGTLIRAGAYYHDIGKLKNPRYFIENQQYGENPHDKLSPVLSAQIIIAHVKDGLEIAAQNKLPKALYRFIEEHHGTTILKYFLEKSEALGEDAIPEQFTYSGPTPHSMETALVMLADSVEAAVKAYGNNVINKTELNDIVNNVVRAKIDAGQLDNVDFTMKELEIIKDTFTSVLVSVYHSREVADIPELVKNLKDTSNED